MAVLSGTANADAVSNEIVEQAFLPVNKMTDPKKSGQARKTGQAPKTGAGMNVCPTIVS